MSIYAGDIYAPYWATYQSGAPSIAFNRVDGNTEKIAYVVCAPKTGTISKVHVTAVVATAPGSDYDVRLETVGSSDGDPTGTLFDTNTNGALTLLSDDDNEWLPTILTAGASVTRGEEFAVVLVPPASPGIVDWNSFGDASAGFPYTDWYSGAAWTKISTRSPLILLEYSDGSIPRIPNCFPWTGAEINSGYYSDTGGIGPYMGNRFQLREATEIVGVWFLGDLDADDITITLYEGNSTVRRSLTLKKHHTGGTGGSYTQYAKNFSTPYNASASTVYRLSAINNYATASGTPMGVQGVNIDPSSIQSDIWDHMPYAGLFSEFHKTTSLNLSSWTDTTNKMLMIGPIIRSIG